jgi:hypothetical protein
MRSRIYRESRLGCDNLGLGSAEWTGALVNVVEDLPQPAWVMVHHCRRSIVDNESPSASQAARVPVDFIGRRRMPLQAPQDVDVGLIRMSRIDNVPDKGDLDPVALVRLDERQVGMRLQPQVPANSVGSPRQ